VAPSVVPDIWGVVNGWGTVWRDRYWILRGLGRGFFGRFGSWILRGRLPELGLQLPRIGFQVLWEVCRFPAFPFPEPVRDFPVKGGMGIYAVANFVLSFAYFAGSFADFRGAARFRRVLHDFREPWSPSPGIPSSSGGRESLRCSSSF
jgi:hypothetical protein